MNSVAGTDVPSRASRKALSTLQHFGAMVAAVALSATLSAPAQSVNIVVNGSFETGDFTGWTLTGNTGFSGVECPGAPFAGPGDGNCDAFFGPVGSNAILSQTFNTITDALYSIGFDFRPDGGNPSFFSASFGGSLLTSLINPAAGPYQVLNFTRVATGPTTTISFAFRDDPGFLLLDSVSVSRVPEPGTMALLGLGMIGLFLGKRKAR